MVWEKSVSEIGGEEGSLFDIYDFTYVRSYGRMTAMKLQKFEGCWTAMVTPLIESGELDLKGLRKNMGFQIRGWEGQLRNC